MTSRPATASPEIALLDLAKRFGDVRAVDGVTLDIGTGFGVIPEINTFRDEDRALTEDEAKTTPD
jgi:hypothetical protein